MGSRVVATPMFLQELRLNLLKPYAKLDEISYLTSSDLYDMWPRLMGSIISSVYYIRSKFVIM